MLWFYCAERLLVLHSSGLRHHRWVSHHYLAVLGLHPDRYQLLFSVIFGEYASMELSLFAPVVGIPCP
jgi:hypothetical protein